MRKYAKEETRQLTAEEVKAIAEADANNPTITKLIFVETAPTEKRGIGLFPCYPAFWDEKHAVLSFFALQCSGGRYFTAEVHIKEEDIGKRMWFWTMPPEDALAEAVVLLAKMEEDKEGKTDGPALHDGES